LDAKEGLFDEVLGWHINHMARWYNDLFHIVEHLNKHNVAFRSFSENFETVTLMGKFVLQMMGPVGYMVVAIFPKRHGTKKPKSKFCRMKL
jgi:site-specific DNA recombinase